MGFFAKEERGRRLHGCALLVDEVADYFLTSGHLPSAMGRKACSPGMVAMIL